MKRLFFVICTLLLFILVLNGCEQEKKINNIVQTDFNYVTKIIFFNGRTGEQVSVEDKEKIKEFMSLVDSYEVKQIEGSPEVKPGTAYSSSFFVEEEESFNLSFDSSETNSNLGINGNEYSVIRTKLTIEKIDSFFQ